MRQVKWQSAISDYKLSQVIDGMLISCARCGGSLSGNDPLKINSKGQITHNSVATCKAYGKRFSVEVTNECTDIPSQILGNKKHMKLKGKQVKLKWKHIAKKKLEKTTDRIKRTKSHY